MAEARTNPYAAFNFVVSYNNSEDIGAFMEVSGLDGENAIIEYREGADQTKPGNFVRKLPGLERYPNVVLRRGITGNLKLWQLRKSIRDADDGADPKPPEFAGEIGPSDPEMIITLQDEKHDPVMRWHLRNAWISKLSGPSLNAKANEIAIESVEVVCEQIEIEE